MKVGMLVSSMSRSAGGIYDAARWLARTLDAMPGQTVEVFGLGDRHAAEDASGWGRVSVRCFGTRGPAAFGYAPRMLGALSDADPDLMHLHGLWMYPSVACRQWSRRTGKPHVITAHGMLDPWALSNSHWKKVLAKVLYENRNLQGAACLQAGSLSEYRAIRDAGFRNPVAVLANGVHLHDSSHGLRSEPSWSSELKPGAKVLLYLGRIHPKKGLDLLLDGWKQAMIGSDPGWELVIAGVGAEPYEQQLKERSTSLGIASSVHFVGPQYHDAKIASYCRADALILPSYSEGIPMVVLDGWAHALPVLMTPECNLPIGFEQDAAIRVETTMDSISEGLKSLFGMTDVQRAALGTRGRDIAKNEFSWSAIAGKMLGVYEWVLGGGQPPECVIVD